MKRLLFILIAVAVAACAFGQQMTWINPGVTSMGLLPKSMLADLTYGLFYDEIDIIALAPAELSNYSGIGLFTGYSNYDFYWNTGFGPSAAATNPFDPASGVNYGRYLAGVTLPVNKYRAGAFAGFELNQNPLLDPGNAGVYTDTAYTFSSNTVIDANTIGTADYTTTITESAIGTRMLNQVSAVTGVDLGFMGAAVLFNWQSNTDTVGGNLNYTWTVGSDAAYVTPANIITNYWGLLGKADAANPGPSGNVQTYTRQANQWVVAATGELPWKFPVTANVAVGGGQNNGLGYVYPVTAIWAINNAGGTASAVREGWTIGGLAPSAANTYAYLVTSRPADGSAFDVTGLTLGALTPASNPAAFKDSDFFGRLGGQIDPMLTLSSNIALRARGGISYTLDLKSQNNATIRAVHYTSITGGTGNFTSTQTISAPSTGLSHIFDLDLGGVFEFTESTKFLTADIGLFYIPTYTFQSTTLGNAVTTLTTSYTETAPVTPDATAATVAIGPGNARGTMVTTGTTAYTGATGTTTIANKFVLPVAVKLNIVPDKLQLVGAYQLSYTYTPEITWSNQNSTATNVTTIANQAGTNVTPAAPVASVASATSESSDTVIATYSAWAGTPNFMVRWMPLPQLTLDFWGQTVITAIGQPLLTFNLGTFATTIGVNASFRF